MITVKPIKITERIDPIKSHVVEGEEGIQAVFNLIKDLDWLMEVDDEEYQRHLNMATTFLRKQIGTDNVLGITHGRNRETGEKVATIYEYPIVASEGILYDQFIDEETHIPYIEM